MIWGLRFWDLEILLKQKYLRYYGFDIFFLRKLRIWHLVTLSPHIQKKKKSSKSFIKPTGKMYHLIFYSNNLN